MYPKRASWIPHFDGYSSSIENIVHLYGHTRYNPLHTGRSPASRRNDSPEIRVVSTTTNFWAKKALLLFKDSIWSLWQLSSNPICSFWIWMRSCLLCLRIGWRMAHVQLHLHIQWKFNDIQYISDLGAQDWSGNTNIKDSRLVRTLLNLHVLSNKSLLYWLSSIVEVVYVVDILVLLTSRHLPLDVVISQSSSKASSEVHDNQ